MRENSTTTAAGARYGLPYGRPAVWSKAEPEREPA
jgi:hypothetical protein